MTVGNGIFYSMDVKTYGDKDEVTFEQLEGRRYYLKTFTQKMAASRKQIYNFKFKINRRSCK